MFVFEYEELIINRIKSLSKHSMTFLEISKSRLKNKLLQVAKYTFKKALINVSVPFNIHFAKAQSIVLEKKNKVFLIIRLKT